MLRLALALGHGGPKANKPEAATAHLVSVPTSPLDQRRVGELLDIIHAHLLSREVVRRDRTALLVNMCFGATMIGCIISAAFLRQHQAAQLWLGLGFWFGFSGLMLVNTVRLFILPVFKTILTPWKDLYPSIRKRILSDVELAEKLYRFEDDVIEFAHHSLSKESSEFATRVQLFYGPIQTTGFVIAAASAWAALHQFAEKFADKNLTALLLAGILTMLGLTAIAYVRQKLERQAFVLEREHARRRQSRARATATSRPRSSFTSSSARRSPARNPRAART